MRLTITLIFVFVLTYSIGSVVALPVFDSTVSQLNFDTLRIEMGEFEILYSEELLQPVQATYTVTCPDAFVGECETSIGWRVSRAKEFAGYDVATSKPKHYEKNDWDRGHLIPVASVDCDCASKALTYTYLNCALQDSGLNRGPWKQLEGQERKLAKSIDDEVEIIVDVLFDSQSAPMCYGCPTIPSAFRKTIIAGGDTMIYKFPNQDISELELSVFRIH